MVVEFSNWQVITIIQSDTNKHDSKITGRPSDLQNAKRMQKELSIIWQEEQKLDRLIQNKIPHLTRTDNAESWSADAPIFYLTCNTFTTLWMPPTANQRRQEC